MRNTRRVLISGASIAGPALAYWLNLYGFRVTVVERAPGPRPGGQAIDVRGPALEVCERMGVLEEIRARRTGLRGMSMVDDNGKELFSTTEHTASGGSLSSTDIEILRDDLSSVLLTAGGDGIEYLYNDSIASLAQGTDEVAVTFHRGDSRAFDIVVAADGVHSSTRALVFGPEENFLRHLGGYLGVWTVPNYLGLDRWEVIYQMPGDVWGGMVMSVRDNTEARVFVGVHSDEPPATFLGSRSVSDQKRLVAERYKDARWEMPRLLEYMWGAPDFHFDATAQIHMDSWSRGRVTLVGDAGYCGSPMSGQSTSMAVVGAYVLAGELKAAGGDHTAAFAAYERELRGYATANQQLALDNRARQETQEPSAGQRPDTNPTHIGDSFYEVVNSYTLKDY
ncbi:FAD-dependent monooxygenase [Streptomyces malaysiensis]|uniref:FAD-dependent monooxygenase n=1 Tax=Streptomyces malaysiensis TaxID=92644 RepID=UPI000BFD7ADE|nr:FAD-dependent monooxygenase [Streptomyces malaysiensis]ATL87515.1 salicylate hydroxylase [Streptomyces malaysiensis]QDL69080.1 FAD-dependent oxidoreductase [Streptomyces malaysiensis]